MSPYIKAALGAILVGIGGAIIMAAGRETRARSAGVPEPCGCDENVVAKVPEPEAPDEAAAVDDD
jgi:hypothetical protein